MQNHDPRRPPPHCGGGISNLPRSNCCRGQTEVQPRACTCAHIYACTCMACAGLRAPEKAAPPRQPHAPRGRHAPPPAAPERELGSGAGPGLVPDTGSGTGLNKTSHPWASEVLDCSSLRGRAMFQNRPRASRLGGAGNNRGP